MFKGEYDFIKNLENIFEDDFKRYENLYKNIDLKTYLKIVIERDNYLNEMFRQIKPLLIKYVNKFAKFKLKFTDDKKIDLENFKKQLKNLNNALDLDDTENKEFTILKVEY
jgi:hypothetical protein